jgi:hypothetical protein
MDETTGPNRSSPPSPTGATSSPAASAVALSRTRTANAMRAPARMELQLMIARGPATATSTSATGVRAGGATAIGRSSSLRPDRANAPTPLLWTEPNSVRAGDWPLSL